MAVQWIRIEIRVVDSARNVLHVDGDMEKEINDRRLINSYFFRTIIKTDSIDLQSKINLRREPYVFVLDGNRSSRSKQAFTKGQRRVHRIGFH